LDDTFFFHEPPEDHFSPGWVLVPVLLTVGLDHIVPVLRSLALRSAHNKFDIRLINPTL
jgi:hypothetical protein